jgi:thioredoxin reductase (NADPH)
MIEATDLLSASVIGADTFDCVVIGGGPAGLTAPIHLRRHGRSVRLVDSGTSRAQRIARALDVAGYPDGVVGGHLLERMRQHLRAADGHVTYDSVEDIRRCPDGRLLLRLRHGTLLARNVILCTGATDPPINLSGINDVASAGLLRTFSWQGVGDLFGMRVGVLGDSRLGVPGTADLRKACAEARFIETDCAAGKTEYSSCNAGLERVPGVASRVALARNSTILVTCDDGRTHEFDVLLAAFGARPRTYLANQLAVRLDVHGAIAIGPTGLTSADNVYAAGDVAGAPRQIDVAIVRAAVAAEAVHDSL